MTARAGSPGTRSGRILRVFAFLLSLIIPGAGHFLLGAFRRGVAWALGLTALGPTIVGLTVFVAIPVSLVTLLIGVVIVPLARVAVAIDAVRTPALRPSWKAVLIACGALLVVTVLVDLFVAEPLGTYYKTHYAQAFTIPSGAMAPTLLVGDYIITDRSAYRSQPPQRGNIIVFKYPQDERRDFIQRIIGLPGNEILIRERQVFVNGVPLSEPYVMYSKLPSSTRLGADAYCSYAFGCTPTVVPPDAYFVMGDNRDNSQDSRYWGFVKREKIVGRATTVYWSWDGATHWLRVDRIGRRL